MAEPHVLLIAALSTALAAVPEGPTRTLPASFAEVNGLPVVLELPRDAAHDVARAEDEPGRARVPDTAKSKPEAKPAAETSKPAKPAKATKAAKVAAPEPEEYEEDDHVHDRSKVGPAIVLVLAATAGIVGGVYVSKTMTAVDSLPTNTTSIAAIRDQQREVLTNGVIATVCLSAAVAALVSGLVLLGN